jgi:hypothetical protein
MALSGSGMPWLAQGSHLGLIWVIELGRGRCGRDPALACAKDAL